MYDKFMKKKHWKKTFLVMRLSCFLACWLTLSAFGTVFSQQKLVNLKVVAESLSNVLMQIKDQTGVKILYNENLLKNYENINLDLNNVEVEEALRQVLANTRFEYEVTDGVIVVKEKKNSFPQQKTVRIQGKVSDEDGAPLPGVTVLIKGTTLGTATDMDGKYSLSVPEGNYILLFTMVGMKTQEVTLKNQTELNIIMQHETSEMDEVVITGYFNQAKNSFTGAARTITAEELQAGGNQNILSALQNIDPSFVKLENNQLGSNPNAIPDFQIRGAGSISRMRDEYSGNPNMPVFIVDGFETTAEKVFDMDPYRVATITLLKDAAATAIYGSRASNGVVVITTTAPASGKMAVSYNGDATFYMADLSAYNLCNPEEKLELEVLAGLYDVEKKQYFNYGSKFADQAVMQRAYNWRLANIREGVNTYWLDKPLNSLTVAHKHSLRLDGGNDYIRYAMEVNYNNTPGVMKESGRERLGLGLELQYIYKNLTFRNQLNYSRVKATNSPYGSFSEYTRLNPYVKYKDEDGNYIYELEAEDRRSNTGSYKFFIYNPLYNTTLDVRDESRYNDLTNLFGIDWQIIEGLRLKGSFSFTLQNTSADVFKPAKHTDFATYTGDDFDRRGSYSASRGDVFDYDASLVLSYFWQANKHVINANLGWNAKQSRTKEFSVMAEGFPNERLDYISFATQYQKNGSPSGNEYTSRLVGFLGNLNYSWDERYLFDLSFREDASSQFGADKRWAPFWSAGLGWNLHNEHFMEGVDWLQQFKIRGSYGLTGSQNYDPYQAITTYEYLTQDRYHFAVGAIAKAMGNRNLAWQRTWQQNYGLDLTLWKNRIDISADYYIKTSKDVLTAVTLAPSLGFSSYMDNLGEVENRGYELSLRATLIRDQSKKIFWSVNGSAIHNKNKLLKISNALKAYNETSDSELDKEPNTDGKKSEVNRPRVRYVEGASMNSIWVNHSLGIDPATGKEIFVARNGDLVTDWSSANYVIGGCTDSKVEGTFGSNFTWKGLSLNMTFRYRIGGQMYNQTLVDKVQDVDPRYNVDKRAFEQRWQEPGDKVRFAAFRTELNGINVDYVTRPTSRFVEDYNYLELATLNLSYEFGTAKLQRCGIKRLKAMFYMNDVFHVSNVKQERGIDYPFARNFSIGLQARF
ncbi:MAG TPA: SusC/RagA family TonB-linked outer membrane protein [Odoribacter splanchnicus]|nr:SusC/RagA family TonB-linked outer membrane protein [Odoribacter splanchnicus]